MISPSDIFIAQYREAAGDGAVLELKLRLLAGKIPALQPFTDAKLENVEEEIARFFAEYLSEDEREQLRLCRQLRNKALHCDFSKARAKLYEMGAPKVRGGVRQIRLTDTTKEGILRHLKEGLSDEPGTHQYVADLSTTADAGVFAWLLELGSAGDFGRAAEVFRQTCKIIDRLATVDQDV